jgi:hypothetical protein
MTFNSTWAASLFLKSYPCILWGCIIPQPSTDWWPSEAARSTPYQPTNSARSLLTGRLGWRMLDEKGGRIYVLQNTGICPLVEDITIDSTFLLACKEPILQALANLRHIKEFMILRNANGQISTCWWQAHEVVSRLFSQWNSLGTVEFNNLLCWPADSTHELAPHSSIPTLHCAIRTMCLNDWDLDEQTLDSF